MKATEVRILPALDPGESYVDSTFVLVETECDDDGKGVTTIEHVASRVVGDTIRWEVTTLGQSAALSHLAALEWAVSFAASRDVPVVYHRDSSVGAPYAAAPSASTSRVSSASK